MRGTASLAALGAAIAVLAASVFASVACSGSEGSNEDPGSAIAAATAISTPRQPRATATMEPTATPDPPANTPEPTAAPDPPANTPEPTAAPDPPANTPEPTATPDPPASTPEPSATSSPQPRSAPATERPPKPATSGGVERGPGSAGEVARQQTQPTDTPASRVKTRASAGSSAGSSPAQEYTWRDGDRVERVRESGLVVQPGSGNTGASVVTRDDGEITQPVFRSQAGDRMTLPGGVLLTLDAAWDQARVNRFFFSDNGIDKSRVQGQDWAVNAFFVETEPGFPSLNLANELAEQEGVQASIPNWQTEVSLR